MSINVTLNYHLIVRILGIITLITGVSMLPALLCAYLYHDPDTIRSLMLSASGCILLGGIVVLFVRPAQSRFRTREGYLVVALCWLVASLLGTFPYYLSDFTGSFIDAFFESTAGFTTTGCTVISAEIMPHALLMWKAISHWLGGMGILVFVISILPALGINGQMIVRAEAPGPVFEKMAVRMSDSAKILYVTYFSLTALEFVLLCFCSSMTPFDALINTLGSISTGGLFAHPGGVGYYNSVYAELVISLFTILASINFILYHYAVTRKWEYVLRDIELRAFLLIITCSTVLCTAVLYLGGDTSFSQALRDSFFQVVSVSTTSGYSSTDYTMWPVFCQMILFTLMFVGGCAASTSGSIKVIRIQVLFKLIQRGFYKRIHPRSVIAVKLGGKAVSAPVVSAISVFILMYMAIFLFSCLVLSLQNLDLETTISTAAAMLSNTGIAFGQVGSTGNYAVYGGALKLYLSLLMIIGRLELFTIIILFSRGFWGRDR